MKEVQIRSELPSTVLAVDLGERYIATSVVIAKGIIKNPRFYGKQVRGIRRHYCWLRKRLGKRKLLSVIKRLGSTEKRKVNAVLHKISRDIVDEAKEQNAYITIGELKGIRKSAKGRRMNRIVSNMPYYKLTQMIIYKAEWEGIQVVKVSERYTSKTCHSCGKRGKRPFQGLCVPSGMDIMLVGWTINIAAKSLGSFTMEGLYWTRHNRRCYAKDMPPGIHQFIVRINQPTLVLLGLSVMHHNSQLMFGSCPLK